MTTSPDIEKIAGSLTEAQHSAWIRTVLMVIATHSQRMAFVAGYNEQAVPKPATQRKVEAHALGVAVRQYLQEHPNVR